MKKVILSLLLMLVVIVGFAAGKIVEKPEAAAAPTEEKVEASVQRPSPVAVFTPYDAPEEPATCEVDTAQLMSVLVIEEPEPEAPKESKYVYFDVPLEDSFQEYIQDVCYEYEFPRPDIIVAMIGAESGYTEKIVSATNDWGYMQINAICHQMLKDQLGIDDFLDGRQNVLAGVYLIQGFWHKYEDAGKALMCYNCGEGGAQNLWKQGVYSTYYSRTILDRAEQLTLREPVA